MSSRVTSEMMLVGSVPADSAEQALHRCGALFGDLAFALPDGETGLRTMWVYFEAWELFRGHPDVEIVQEHTPLPGHPEWVPSNIWSGSYQFRFNPRREGVSYERLPRIDAAIESYGIFRAQRDRGVIPEGVRFQVCLPFPASCLGWFFTTDFERDYPLHERAYEEAWRRELDRMLAAIPAQDLAIQWDICFEVLDLEGVFPYTSRDGAWERFAGPCRRLSQEIPDEVLLGHHLCYGTFPQWPIREADDMQLLVDMANACVTTSGRTVDYLHLAGPRLWRSLDDDFYRPLQQLRPGDAKVFLGLILPNDGAPGLTMRSATASKYLDDFGVAMYCGFGRQPGEEPEATLRAHREAVDGLFASRASSAG